MLASANRIVRGDDYRNVVRRGRKSATAHVVVSVVRQPADCNGPTRFGFIVAKTVGNAVTRNLIRRRLKAIAHDLLVERPQGFDVVVRVLPAASQAGWPTLLEDVTRSFARGVEKAA
ncbi:MULTISPECIES: ribonuclease P protein component [Curtobacterium]|uniref:ribonuclease P protein component n=1 Tax=Curtobacterium TaxID=2034 RepID=UPI00217DC55F|nr:MULTISPECIES: ribonuclease P protein component [Curtobacterium]MCS6561463.1 ribonuclease P protein component [Curtobacterium flaccumfaciens pv. poinsettiae]MDT0232633.1 ribonuclease P protein component [Curtobacterium sp. BRB10]UXN29196.1 ribonuclease P protein component [Curtobacterium flaccumfaciens]